MHIFKYAPVSVETVLATENVIRPPQTSETVFGKEMTELLLTTGLNRDDFCIIIVQLPFVTGRQTGLFHHGR